MVEIVMTLGLIAMAIGGLKYWESLYRGIPRKPEALSDKDMDYDFHKQELVEWDASFLKLTGKEVSRDATFAWSPRKQTTVQGTWAELQAPGLKNVFGSFPEQAQGMQQIPGSLNGLSDLQGTYLDQQMQMQQLMGMQKPRKQQDILSQLLGGLGRGIWPS